MKKQIERLMTLILCIMMVFSMIPEMAFADVNPEEAEEQTVEEVIPEEESVQEEQETVTVEEPIQEALQEEKAEEELIQNELQEPQEESIEEEQAIEESIEEKQAIEESFDNEEKELQEESLDESEIETETEAEDESKQADEDEKDEKAEEDKSTQEEKPEEEKQVAFKASQTVEGVTVTVSAEEGVFPEGAKLSVSKVSGSEVKKVGKAVDKVRDDNANVALSYVFDIHVEDKNGKEIQPADGKKVKVSFESSEISDNNLSTDVYHVESQGFSLNADALDVKTAGDTATVTTDGFSYYTVEFTYGDLQYVMKGDTEIPLNTILDEIGLTGTVTKATSSSPELFSVEQREGQWIVTALQAFCSNETLSLTIDGIDYVVKVTDSQHSHSSGSHGESGAWTAWNDSSKLPTASNNYYLNTDVTLSRSQIPSSGTANIKLCLNGHKITISKGNNGLYDTDSSRNVNLTIYDSADNSGIITNTSTYGAAIRVKAGSTYTLAGGKITNCNCSAYNAPVYLEAGTFTMKGGMICNNTLTDFASVYVAGGTFNMSGGTITGNTNKKASGSAASGVHVISGTFNMSGGSITNNNSPDANSAAGVYFQSPGLFNVKGKVTITGNTSKGKDLNVLVNGNRTIGINGNLDSDSRIGVTTATAPSGSTTIQFTNGLSGKGSKTNFISDNPDYTVMIKNNEAHLIAHKHEFEYSADGDTITATCVYIITDCPLEDRTATIKLVPPTLKVYGGSGSEKATIEGEIPGVTLPNIIYCDGPEETTTAPKNAGQYFAKITLGESPFEATAEISYTIAKADITPVVNIDNWNYGETPKTPSVNSASNPGGGAVTYKYYTDAECTTETGTAQGATTSGGVPSKGGNYWVKATVAETNNYKSGTGTKGFEIVATKITVTGLSFGSKVYDGTTTATLNKDNVQLEGVYPGDDVRIKSATGEFEDKNVSTGKTIKNIVIELEGDDAGGYSATANPTTVTGAIAYRTVTVSGITASEKEYDGNTDATVDTSAVTFKHMVEGDDLKVSASGAFEDANVGDDKTVNLTLGSLSGDDAGNYLLDANDSQKTAKANITPKDMTVSATGYEAEFDGNAHSITVDVTDPAEGYTITYKGPNDADYRSSNPEFTNPGTYEVAYKVVAPNYAEFTGSKTVKIIGKDFAGIDATSVDTTYDGTNHAISVNVPDVYDDYTVTYSVVEDGEYTTAPITYKNYTEGEKAVYYKVSKTGYNDFKGSATVNIAQKEVGLDWTDTVLAYNATAQKPKATATGLVGHDTCIVTVDGAKTDSNAKSETESYTATATALSNNNYKLPANVEQTFTIAQKEVGLEWGEAAFTYNGKAQAPVATATGVEDGDTCKVTVEGAKKDSNAKTETENYTAEATELSDNNYKLPAEVTKDFTIAQQEITVDGIKSEGKVYDGNTDATDTLYYEDEHLVGKVDGDDLELEAKGTFEDPDVGSDKKVTISDLKLTGEDAGNYVLGAEGQQTECLGNITQYEVTVTAINKTKEYGEDDPELTYTYEPELVDDDEFEGALSRHAGENVGEYTITAGDLHDKNKNYAIKYNHATLTITQATQNNVTAVIEGWTYGDDPNAPTANGKFGADTATFTYSDAADGTYTETVPTDAGTWYVKATVAETNNYVGAESDPVEFTIAPKVLELDWSDTELTYNGQAQKPVATATNLEDGDECEVTVGGEQTDSNAKTGTDSYTAEASAVSNPNYTLPDNKTTTFTIAQAEITVSGIKAEDKTYDGNTDADLNYKKAVLDGKIGEEDVTVTATGTFEGKNAGEGKKVTISDLALAGDDAGNYVLAAEGQQDEAKATINKKLIEVTADEKTKRFGQEDPELTYTFEPKLVEGDEFEGALEREEGEDVGDYSISEGTLTAGDNYEIEYTPATFGILQAKNSVEADIEGWTYGDDANEPTAEAAFGEDTVKFTYSTSPDGDFTEEVPTDAGSYYVKATIAETPNYAGAESEPVEFEIAKKEIGLEWSDTELTYNREAQKPTAKATGLVGEDTCNVTVAGEQTDANAKTETENYTAKASELSNPNYKLPENVETTFTIAPKAITQEMLALKNDSIKNNGSKQGPTVTMTDGEALVEDEDYTLSGDVTSDKNGTHTITIEGKGNYTDSIETSWNMYDEKDNSDTEKGKDGEGDIEIYVAINGNTEAIKVENFTIDFAKSLLTKENLERRAAGENILLYVEIIEESVGNVPEADRSLLQNKFNENSAKDIRWFDIKVWKKIGKDAATQIHEIGNAINLSVEIPAEYQNEAEGYTRTFYFGRAHEGEASILGETEDKEIVFSTDKFSTYALAYKDIENKKADADQEDKNSEDKQAARTGDENNIDAWLELMIGAGVIMFLMRRRQEREL